jgi:hypothetical protein
MKSQQVNYEISTPAPTNSLAQERILDIRALQTCLEPFRSHALESALKPSTFYSSLLQQGSSAQVDLLAIVDAVLFKLN